MDMIVVAALASAVGFVFGFTIGAFLEHQYWKKAARDVERAASGR